MVMVIPENERKVYSRDEIHDKFKDKWLYLVNAEYTESRTLIRAKVAVVADEIYEEWESGVYFKLNTKNNSPTAEYGCLLPRTPGITSIRNI